MMYGKYWEFSGNWTEITHDRFNGTSFPAVYIPGYSDERLRIKNLPNIEIEGCYPRSLTKTFPCGRKFTWSEDRYTSILDLVKKSLKFNNFEDIQIEKLENERKWLERRSNETLEKLSELESKNSKLQSQINQLVVVLGRIMEINEKAGPGSRKEVNKIIDEVIKYDYDEENDTTYPVLR